MATESQEQLALDEINVDDPTLEGALEERLRTKDLASSARLVYSRADERARAEIARALGTALDEDGTAVRVGRFRITRTTTAAHSVSFETEAKDRVRIGIAKEPKPARAERTASEPSKPFAESAESDDLLPEPTPIAPRRRRR